MAQSVRLTGARVALSADRAEPIDLTIRGARILRFGALPGPAIEYDLTGHLILPGLINAHDHLEFSLFPRLGRGPYPNASAWAADIYHPEQSPVKEQLLIPKRLRLIRGGIRNLLSGVTTVSHHNPYEPDIFDHDFPVRVIRNFAWAHSLRFSPDIVERFRAAPGHWPFLVHAAEGTDAEAAAEISRLAELGLLRARTVLIHAVAITAAQTDQVRKRGASLVWCPSSNLFTLGRTLPKQVLRSGIPVALGTDSALTSAGDLIDELRIARETSGLPPQDIYRMVTTSAARVLRLNAGQGTLREGGVADLVAVADHGQSPAEALGSLRPELVMVRGEVMSMSCDFAARRSLTPAGFHVAQVAGRGRWLVRADAGALEANPASAENNASA